MDTEQTKPENGYEQYKIVTLENAVMFYLSTVFAIEVPEGYRLIIIRNKKLLWDKIYETQSGLKIAFNRMYKNEPYKPTKALWSHPYSPLTSWIKEKVEITEKGIEDESFSRGPTRKSRGKKR